MWNWTLKLIPATTNVQFVRLRFIAFVLSGVLLVGSVLASATQGLNFGIDFIGGTLVEVSSNDTVDIAALRGRLARLNMGDTQIQEFGSQNDVLIRVAQSANATTAAEDLSVVAKIRTELAGDFEIRRVEVVGPKVSAELIQSGAFAVLAALAAMLIYIWFRFEWQFGVGAVIALTHDVLLTIGIFSVLQLEFNLSILAAILTIVGYSMNDTVIVYDRVRENLRKYKKRDLAEVLDLAVNETLSRTVMTSSTTLLALIALYTLGGEVIAGFTFAMMWGVVVGTYSSIFIAVPLLIFMGVKRDWSL
ncbi:MAG: protein translocase subunit SecF [Alphaproteobacteria bacterium]|nr:protein translocase subunit SecF [Alphaproteobacteria bacterium]